MNFHVAHKRPHFIYVIFFLLIRIFFHPKGKLSKLKGFEVKVPLARPVFDGEMGAAALDALQNEVRRVRTLRHGYFNYEESCKFY